MGFKMKKMIFGKGTGSARASEIARKEDKRGTGLENKPKEY